MLTSPKRPKPYRRYVVAFIRLVVCGISCAGMIWFLIKPPYYIIQTIRVHGSQYRPPEVTGQYVLYRAQYWIWEPPDGRYYPASGRSWEQSPYLDISRVVIYESLCLLVLLLGWFLPGLLLRPKPVLRRPLRHTLTPDP